MNQVLEIGKLLSSSPEMRAQYYTDPVFRQCVDSFARGYDPVVLLSDVCKILKSVNDENYEFHKRTFSNKVILSSLEELANFQDKQSHE